MRTLTKKDLVLPRRKRDTHKGAYGRVLVVGGSEEFVGAVALAGLAALRAGCDLVTVAAPEKVAWAINKYTPDLITVKLKGSYLRISHYSQLKKLAEKSDVVLLGNGAGLRKTTQQLMKKLVAMSGKKVIDADGMKAIDANIKDAILTPHKRELQIFLKNSGVNTTDPEKLRTSLEHFFKSNVLLIKGGTDVIIGRSIVQNKTGNPGMTKGGTGDVLAGLCAGYYAQMSIWQAACNAAYINGALGDALKKKKGYTYLASDLIEEMKKF